MIVNHTSRLLGERKMSIAAAARASGLAYTTVHDLYHEQGRRVGWDTLDAMCRALNLASISELIEYVPNAREPHQFVPLSGSQDQEGHYQRCGVDGCNLSPEMHERRQRPAPAADEGE